MRSRLLESLKSGCLSIKTYEQFAADWRSRGWRMPQKRLCSRRFFLFTRSKTYTANLQIIWRSFLQRQQRSPSALTGWWTSCSLLGFLKALRNLGMWLTRLNLMQAKYPTINYFGKDCKKHLKVKMNHTTTCTLQMMRFAVISITLTSGK